MSFGSAAETARSVALTVGWHTEFLAEQDFRTHVAISAAVAAHINAQGSAIFRQFGRTSARAVSRSLT